MAKKSMIQREELRKKLILKYRTKRNTIKNLLLKSAFYEDKIHFHKKMVKLPRDSSLVRQRNRCWVTGRSRAFYRDFGLSRHVLREMAHDGFVPGLKKASW